MLFSVFSTPVIVESVYSLKVIKMKVATVEICLLYYFTQLLLNLTFSC